MKASCFGLTSVALFITGFCSVANCVNQPVCDSPVVTVDEDVSTDYVLTTCTVCDGCTLVIYSDTPTGSFSVSPEDSTKWDVTFAYPPDYETTPSLTLILVVSDGTSLSPPVTIIVVVLDVDDNYPVITVSETTVTVPENIILDDILTINATDADGSDTYNQNTITFAFTGENLDYGGTFQLTPVTVNGKVATTTISLLKELDYETFVSYSLMVSAADGGGLTSSVALVVNVQDVEDTAPVFVSAPSYIAIPQSTPPGTLLFTVVAIDGDRGINNPVQYKISSGDDNGDFNIDPISGDVTVAKVLSSVTTLYVLNITATEQNVEDTSVPYESTITCTISLNDGDNHGKRYRSK